MEAHFHTDGSVVNTGFSVHYEAIYDCGELNIEAGSGDLQSINYPAEYPNNVHCTWTITAAEEMDLRVTITDFLLEGGVGCPFDYLELSDVSGYDSGRLCDAAGVGYEHVFTETPVTISFVTDGSVIFTGFSLEYEAVHDCGLPDIEAGSGVLQSINYPENYPDNVDCTWTITAELGMNVQVNITDFLLEGGEGCPYDYLELSDASGYFSGRLCDAAGSGYVHVFTGSPVTITFYTDRSVTNTGFSLEYEAVPDFCSRDPCEHGGTCVVVADEQGYMCECVDGYSGTNCELDSCSSNPCANGGTCTSDGEGYVCECTALFTGTDCEIAACEDTWSLGPEDSDGSRHCYKIFPDRVDVAGAREMCTVEGAELAPIDEDEDFMKQMVEDYALGLRRRVARRLKVWTAECGGRRNKCTVINSSGRLNRMRNHRTFSFMCRKQWNV